MTASANPGRDDPDSHTRAEIPASVRAGAPRADVATDEPRCIVCQSAMYEVHCKRICPNCGYCEDCSDLFPA
jgi:hypothetical protein